MDKNLKEIVNDVEKAIKQKTLEIIALRNLKDFIIQNQALNKGKKVNKK
jgi:hypothetical protein